jgi:hypothetical protein
MPRKMPQEFTFMPRSFEKRTPSNEQCWNSFEPSGAIISRSSGVILEWTVTSGELV